MSSSSSQSSARSESSESSSPSPDEIHLYKVASPETIQPLLEGVPRTPDPLAPVQPSAMRILYSQGFDNLMGAYRTMRANPAMYGSGVAGGTTSTAATADAEARDEERGCTTGLATARWLLLLAFALRQSTSNYTIWKDRRDVILSSAAFRTAHVDCLPSVLLVVRSLAQTEEARARAEEEQSAIEDVAQRWLPHMPADYLSDGAYSVWRAVRWELAVTGAFAHLYHKQFQVWHHRKELIGAALSAMPPPLATSALSSAAQFDAYLREHHNLTFADVDERQTIDYVLLNCDAKNYHVWLHRAWFFHALPFLLSPPSWAALGAYADAVDAVVGEARAQAVAFCPESEWGGDGHAQDAAGASGASSLYVPMPASPFTDELHFTATLIRADPWNNSAWCHRYVLFEAHLVPFLLAQFGARGHAAGEAPPSQAELVRVLAVLCWQEVYHALQWAAVTPCNECPYVHARCIAELHQTVLLRLALLNTSATGLSAEQHEALLTAPLASPVSAATASHGSDRPALPLPLSSVLPWPHFAATFGLLTYVQDVTRTHIAPRVEALPAQCQAAAAIRDASARETAMRELILRGGSAQFAMDNLHQSAAAQYHALFYFLEQCWLLFFSREAREAIAAERAPSYYALNGVNEDLAEVPCEGEADAVLAAKTVFLEKEVRALVCVKALHKLDTIRAKYWRHEASTVLHRQY